ncbi:MAG: hypothetical protein KIT16_06300 [Rhodospirillaceae bacterium]|nr:hypothetical protein [Rhodospirillaceae bacterium]
MGGMQRFRQQSTFGATDRLADESAAMASRTRALYSLFRHLPQKGSPMRVFALLAILLVAAPAVAAEGWGPPTSPYSATLDFTDGSGETLKHTIHFTAERQRLDYKVGEREESVIVDKVEAAVFILYPQLKRYRKAPLVEPEFDFGIGRETTKREKLGEEAMAGRPTVKYKVEAKTAQGQVFTGFAWLTAERIVVRLEGEVQQGRRKRKLVMAASALKVGPVDPAVFRIPADFQRIEDKSR